MITLMTDRRKLDLLTRSENLGIGRREPFVAAWYCTIIGHRFTFIYYLQVSKLDRAHIEEASHFLTLERYEKSVCCSLQKTCLIVLKKRPISVVQSFLERHFIGKKIVANFSERKHLSLELDSSKCFYQERVLTWFLLYIKKSRVERTFLERIQGLFLLF